MTPTSYIEPLELGKRVMAVLHGGRRTATYKLATLSALIDYCEQHARLDDPGASIDVPINALVGTGGDRGTLRGRQSEGRSTL